MASTTASGRPFRRSAALMRKLVSGTTRSAVIRRKCFEPGLGHAVRRHFLSQGTHCRSRAPRGLQTVAAEALSAAAYGVDASALPAPFGVWVDAPKPKRHFSGSNFSASERMQDVSSQSEAETGALIRRRYSHLYAVNHIPVSKWRPGLLTMGEPRNHV